MTRRKGDTVATKTIVRYVPPNPLIGRRELRPSDFETLGIFTQETPLFFDKEKNFWLDAEAAGISKEALQWFKDSPEFTVETQEVKGKEDPQALQFKEAYDASLGGVRSPAPEGEATSGSDTSSAHSTTTRSTAKP
jgi:hypothetical protein